MTLIWCIAKTFAFDIKYIYLLLSVSVLQSKSEKDRFHEKGFCKFIIHTLGCIATLLFWCLVEIILRYKKE